MARQGVRYPVVEEHIVGDRKTCTPVPKDGITIGEILIKGNAVMLGYLKDRKATAEAFAAAGCTPATLPCATRTTTSR
jgi:fatty-acyl-CoA synthase